MPDAANPTIPRIYKNLFIRIDLWEELFSFAENTAAENRPLQLAYLRLGVNVITQKEDTKN